MNISSQNAKRRHLARLSAVQALYQMEIADAKSKQVVREFNEHWFETEGGNEDGDENGDGKITPDRKFFESLVLGVVAEQDAIDVAVAKRLNKKWKLSRMDATLRAIMRCGCYELLRSSEIPAIVIIDEYVGLARDFFEDKEPGYVNAALDKLAREFRADEMSSEPVIASAPKDG